MNLCFNRAHLCDKSYLVHLGPLKVRDAVVAGDVADGDVDLGIGEQLRILAVVECADREDVRSLE